MFRVDSTTWINPVYVKKINVFNKWGDVAYSVSIETDDGCYISDTFPTFEEAEAYVQKLIDQLNCQCWQYGKMNLRRRQKGESK